MEKRPQMINATKAASDLVRSRQAFMKMGGSVEAMSDLLATAMVDVKWRNCLDCHAWAMLG